MCLVALGLEWSTGYRRMLSHEGVVRCNLEIVNLEALKGSILDKDLINLRT
jgi:hypothetical protein